MTGWISGPERARQHLESLGVEVGPRAADGHGFDNCRVSDEAFERLHDYWGRYIWDLKREGTDERDSERGS